MMKIFIVEHSISYCRIRHFERPPVQHVSATYGFNPFLDETFELQTNNITGYVLNYLRISNINMKPNTVTLNNYKVSQSRYHRRLTSPPACHVTTGTSRHDR